jgi:mono/diheme cytochrome c family protein
LFSPAQTDAGQHRHFLKRPVAHSKISVFMKPLTIFLTASLTAAALLLAAAAGAALVVYSGMYDVSASRQHTQWVYSLLETTMRQSVRLRARDIDPPPLDDTSRIQRGAACFAAKCVQCHGAPGVSAGDVGKSLQPIPGPLVDALQRWQPREIYWITRHGIKMSGMPAWEFRLQDKELWDIVAFVNHLPTLTPQGYTDITQAASATPAAACGQPKTTPQTIGAATGNIERGRQALYQYACNSCHTIPGVTSSFPNVGPPLQGLASRSLIAGKIANTPANLALWIQDPKSVKPLSAMPDMGVSDAHAADIVAYLATLR